VKKDDPELVAALASVADGPGDESRKRVLSDLLLERGDPRGEFLLLQFLIAENKASGAIRQRAQELWRSHKREWMAGVERLLEEVKLDRGFPVEARLVPRVMPEQLKDKLSSPMLSTLRKLEASHEDVPTIVEAIASERLRELREVSLRIRQHLWAAAERGVPHRLTALQLEFELTVRETDLLLGSPVFSKLARLTVRAGPSPTGSRSRPNRTRVEPELSFFGDTVAQLSAHPALKRLTVSGDSFGEVRRFHELAPRWPKLTFEQLTVPGSFELTREAEGTVVMLQNLSIEQMIALRPLMPAGTKRVLLMPRHHTGAFSERESAREQLLKAYAGLEPKTLP
jgi:hypothetical protein